MEFEVVGATEDFKDGPTLDGVDEHVQSLSLAPRTSWPRKATASFRGRWQNAAHRRRSHLEEHLYR